MKNRDNTVVVNDPFARRLVNRYLSHRQDDIDSLRSALENRDFESIQKKGHNLFGSGSAYGFDSISDIGANLEKKAQKRNSDALEELIDRLEDFLQNVRVV